MDTQQTFTPPAAGDRVETDWGVGTVTHASGRRVAIELDDGMPINVVTGTFGYYRLIVVAAGE